MINRKYYRIDWEVKSPFGNYISNISFGIMYDRTIPEVYEILEQFGYTQRKWYEFWKPKIILTPSSTRI